MSIEEKTEHEINEVIDRVAIYNEDPEIICDFGFNYPSFPRVVADLLKKGIRPEEITRDYVKKMIEENEEYKTTLGEFLSPLRTKQLWEFGGWR